MSQRFLCSVNVPKRTCAVLCAAGCIAYLALYYCTPLPVLGQDPRTGEAFDRLGFHVCQLMHAGELMSQWFGGDQMQFNVLDRAPVLLLATIIIAASYAIGRCALTALAVSAALTPLEQCVFATALGLSLLSTYTLIVGLCGGLQSRWPVVVLAVVVVAALVQCIRDSRRLSTHDVARDDHRVGYALCIVIAFNVLIAIGSVMPPWHFDVRAYHLQAPKEWFLAGAIDVTPHNVYSNMPLGAEMHALLAMVLWPGRDAWWWGALVGKVVIASFAPLTGLALYAAGRRFFTPLAGGIAAVVFITTPWVIFLSFTGLIECVLGLYLLLGVYALLISRSDVAHVHRRRLVVLAGLLAGSAAACKYPAIVFVVLPLLLMACVHRASVGQRWAIDWRAVALFAVGVIAACGVWYGKNVVWTGNPTYPLLYTVFGGEHWDEQKNERWSIAHAPPRDDLGNRYSPGQLAASVAKLGWMSTGHTPLLLPLVALSLFTARRHPAVKAALLLSVYSLLIWWLITHRFDRFLTPVLPLLSLAAGVGGARLLQQPTRKITASLLLAVVALNGLFATSHVLGDNRFLVPLAKLRQDVQPMHAYMNQHLDEDDRVLLVGDAAPFNLTVPHLYNTCFDHCIFTQLMKGKSRDERIAGLRDLGITYIYVSWRDIAVYRRDGDYGYSNFVTPQIVYRDLVQRESLLSPVETGVPRRVGALFRVK